MERVERDSYEKKFERHAKSKQDHARPLVYLETSQSGKNVGQDSFGKGGVFSDGKRTQLETQCSVAQGVCTRELVTDCHGFARSLRETRVPLKGGKQGLLT